MGDVLSPFLFNVCFSDIFVRLSSSDYVCAVPVRCVGVLMCA